MNGWRNRPKAGNNRCVFRDLVLVLFIVVWKKKLFAGKAGALFYMLAHANILAGCCCILIFFWDLHWLVVCAIILIFVFCRAGWVCCRERASFLDLCARHILPRTLPVEQCELGDQ